MEPDCEDIVSILKFLHEKTIEDCGDGEAIWLTNFYKLKDIVDIIKNSNINTSWIINEYDNFIHWHSDKDEEGIIITNDKNTFDRENSCIELKLQLH